jgi:hypothetical protein
MYLISNSLYPNDKAKDVANMYLKAMAKYPDDNSTYTTVVPAAIRSSFEGIGVMIIYEVKKGKLDDAITLAVNRNVMCTSVPGYRYSLNTYLNLEEAMKAIGM